MKIGPKYKLCRRLGSNVFEKCQTQKFALNQEKKSRTMRRPRSRSNYGQQLIEKQKARFTYGVSERQFRRYVWEALETGGNPADNLFQRLEERLDNVIFRLGYANSRPMARQLVSHGHFLVNGKRLTVPSHQIKEGDIISLRPNSSDKGFISKEGEGNKSTIATPAWLSLESKKNEAKVVGRPSYEPSEQQFDLTRVIEFYSR